MTILLLVLFGIPVVVLLMPSLSDLVSLFHRNRPADGAATGEPPLLLFLVPAHDEEGVIEASIRSIQAQRYDEKRIRIVVVADNCADNTAAVAEVAGVECLRRTAPEHLGKPRALEWALNRLAGSGADAVVIVDADSVVDPGFAHHLASRRPLEHKVVQPFNGVSNTSDNALTRLSALLSAARFSFAFRLKHRAGLNVPLSNGMCLGIKVLERYGWNAFSLSEDWELYAQYTARGVPIEVAPAAIIRSEEARSLKQSASQRKRWTAGKTDVLISEAGPIWRSREISLRQKFDALAELAAPGPAVHVGLAGLLAAAAILSPLPSTAKIALLAALGAGVARIAVYTALALWQDPDPLRTAFAFLFLPPYILWRLVIQVGSYSMVGSASWVKTDRNTRAGR